MNKRNELSKWIRMVPNLITMIKDCGVPQGSMFRRTFVYFICKRSFKLYVFLCAKATLLVHAHEYVDEIKRSIQEDLKSETKWCEINQLYINLKANAIIWY